MGTEGRTNPGLRDKKHFVTVLGELAANLGRGSDDRSGVVIGGASERHMAIQAPQIGDPFLLVFNLAKTRRPGQPASDRSDHEGYRSVAHEKRERTRQGGRHWEDAQNDIELSGEDAAAQLSPGEPFKGKGKGIHEGGQPLSVEVIVQELCKSPVKDALE